MSILKTYAVQVHHVDGGIDNVKIKARSLPEANRLLEEQYASSDSYVALPAVRLDVDRKQWKDHWSSYSPHTTSKKDVFANKSRFGRFVFRHKGRKIRGKPNYAIPNGGYGDPQKLVVFLWQEKYGRSTRDFLREWTKQINQNFDQSDTVGKLKDSGHEKILLVGESDNSTYKDLEFIIDFNKS